MVGQQANGVQPQVRKDLSANAVLMLQTLLSVRGGVTLMVAEPRPGLMQVHKDTRTVARNLLEGSPDGAVAIAVHRSEDIAQNAVRMHSHQNALAARDVAVHQREMLLWNNGAGVSDGPKIAELGVDPALVLAVNKTLGLKPISNQVGYRDHLEAVHFAKVDELRDPGHRPVVIH